MSRRGIRVTAFEVKAACMGVLLPFKTSFKRKLEIKFTHANVQGLSEILNSTETTCSLKIGRF